MMRKDVRIGFAIGGVLLAVLIVYGLVTSGPNPSDTEVTLAPDPAGSSAGVESSTSGAGNPTNPSNSEGAAGASSGTAASDPLVPGRSSPGGVSPANNSGATPQNGNGAAKTGIVDKWEHALKTGEVPLMMTETPPLPTSTSGNAPSNSNSTADAGPAANGAAPASNGNAPGAVDDAPAVDRPATVHGPDSAGGLAPEGSGSSTDSTGTTIANPASAGANRRASGGTGATTPPFDAGELTRMASVPTTQPLSSGDSSSAGSGQRTHVVQRGETFASIAEMAYGSEAYYPHLMRANPSINPKKLKAGMTIVLPAREQVVARPGSGAGLPPASGAGSPAAGAGSSTGGSAAAAATPIDQQTQYRVQPADSLYKISLKLYGRADKVDAIYQLNKELIGPDPSRLRAGTVLKLPEPPTTGGNATAAR